MHRFRASFTISSSLSPEWKDGWMNEWMDGWMNEWMNEWMDGWMDGWNEWTDDWTNEWMNEWMNEWTNGRMDEWMNVLGYIKLSQHCLLVYIYINTWPLSEPSRFYVLLLLSSRSCLAPNPPSLGSLSLTWPHMSACWSPPPPPPLPWLDAALSKGDKIHLSPHSQLRRGGPALAWSWHISANNHITHRTHIPPFWSPWLFFSIHFQKSQWVRPHRQPPPPNERSESLKQIEMFAIIIFFYKPTGQVLLISDLSCAKNTK